MVRKFWNHHLVLVPERRQASSQLRQLTTTRVQLSQEHQLLVVKGPNPDNFLMGSQFGHFFGGVPIRTSPPGVGGKESQSGHVTQDGGGNLRG